MTPFLTTRLKSPHCHLVVAKKYVCTLCLYMCRKASVLFPLPLVPPSSLAFMESALAAAFRTISFPKEDEEADE